MASQIPLHVEVEGVVFSRQPIGGRYRYFVPEFRHELSIVEDSVEEGVPRFCVYAGGELRKTFRGRAALTNACKFAVKKILKARTVSAEEPNGHSGIPEDCEGEPEAGSAASRAPGGAEGS